MTSHMILINAFLVSRRQCPDAGFFKCYPASRTGWAI